MCLCVAHHYLHLDLHTAVRKLLNHALDPYERLHLSDRAREWTRSEGRALSWTASLRQHITGVTQWKGQRDCVCTRETITVKKTCWHRNTTQVSLDNMYTLM